ncbi:MAG: exodeoxyribonuclease VII small subunit [Alphaproteobacteria bacterium]|nr:exodeoxyribonuclease VII small subunit [Alphaproteobacteria bacterium]
MTEATSPDIEKLSFEEAMSELEAIVRKLESGEIKLEESIDAYERGSRLKEHCQEKLKNAKARIDKISIGPDGAARAEPADID